MGGRWGHSFHAKTRCVVPVYGTEQKRIDHTVSVTDTDGLEIRSFACLVCLCCELLMG